jgi:hypothetical protein
VKFSELSEIRDISRRCYRAPPIAAIQSACISVEAEHMECGGRGGGHITVVVNSTTQTHSSLKSVAMVETRSGVRNRGKVKKRVRAKYEERVVVLYVFPRTG